MMNKFADKHILIVDDFENMHKLIKSNLISQKYRNFHSAMNGVEALQVCERHSIDLIITDWNMPKMDGLELLIAIRANAATANIPVLMITAETNDIQVSRAINAGVNEFMVKPFLPQKLYEKVHLIFMGKCPSLRGKQTKINTDMLVKNHYANQEISTEPARVLVVDDLPSNIDVIRGILKDHYKVQVATSGKKALAIVNTFPTPDVILLDIMMPEMDGLEVCRRLKKNDATKDIPVIFLTAVTDTKTALSGFELGAVDYIHKPVNPKLLRARVQNHVDLKRSKEQLNGQINNLMEIARLREDVDRITKHDIKSPLSFIIGQSSELADNKFIGMQYRESIKEINTSAVTILNIINSSLNIFKMETNEYQFEPEKVDTIKLLTKIRSDMSSAFKDIRIKLNIASNETTSDADFMLKGEEVLCFSLFSNLVKNALEASKAKDTVTIKVETKSDIIVSIHNSAEIPFEIQNVFFDKYVTSGKKSGTGIGTYSARLMTETQNGAISFTTSATEGTTLIVALPIWKDK